MSIILSTVEDLGALMLKEPHGGGEVLQGLAIVVSRAIGTGVYGSVYRGAWLQTAMEATNFERFGVAGVHVTHRTAVKLISVRDDEEGGTSVRHGPQLLRELLLAATPHPSAPLTSLLRPPPDAPYTWALCLPLGEGDLETALGWSRWVAAFEDATAAVRRLSVPPLASSAPLPDCLTLALTRVTARRPVPLRIVRWVFAQVALQLARLHGAGVAHRDIKPANVIVKWRGGAAVPPTAACIIPPCTACAHDLCCAHKSAAEVVGDGAPFSAFLVDGSIASSATLSLERDIVSLWWRAPELLVCEAHGTGDCALCTLRRHGPSVDVWALGMMMLAAVVGRNVSAATTVRGVFADCKAEIGSLLAEVRSPALQDLLRGMLQVQPERRSRAAEVIDHAWWCEEDCRGAALDAATASTLQGLEQRAGAGLGAALAARQSSRVVRVEGGVMMLRASGAPPSTPRFMRAVHRHLAVPLLLRACKDMAPQSRGGYHVAFTAMGLWDALSDAPVRVFDHDDDDVKMVARRAAAVLAAAMAVAGDVMMPSEVQLGYLRRAAEGMAASSSPDSAAVMASAVAAIAPRAVMRDALAALAAASYQGIRALCPRTLAPDCGSAVTFFPLALRVMDAAAIPQHDQLTVFDAVATLWSVVAPLASSVAPRTRAPPPPPPPRHTPSSSCACCSTYKSYAGMLRGAAIAHLSPLQAAHVAAALPHACRYEEATDAASPAVWALRFTAMSPPRAPLPKTVDWS